MTLIASSFLAGSLLSLLIPVFLLIALVVWYVKFIQRVPETAEGEEASAAENPGPATAPGAAPNPGQATPSGGAPPETRHTPGEPGQ